MWGVHFDWQAWRIRQNRTHWLVADTLFTIRFGRGVFQYSQNVGLELDFDFSGAFWWLSLGLPRLPNGSTGFVGCFWAVPGTAFCDQINHIRGSGVTFLHGRRGGFVKIGHSGYCFYQSVLSQ